MDRYKIEIFTNDLGLLFITMQILAILVMVAMYRYPRLRYVEDELLDAF